MVYLVMTELEGALDRASDEFAQEADGGTPQGGGQDPASEPETP